MKYVGKKRRHIRFTKRIKGTQTRPRLTVFRSKKHIYAQLVNDIDQKVITGCSTLSESFKKQAEENKEIKSYTKDAAKSIGLLLAQKAKERGIECVAFDRGGCKFHGRVKTLAEGARIGGLKF